MKLGRTVALGVGVSMLVSVLVMNTQIHAAPEVPNLLAAGGN